MAKDMKITVRTWVHKDGELTEVCELSPDEQKEVATQLKLKWLNALYAGKAKFEKAPEP